MAAKRGFDAASLPVAPAADRNKEVIWKILSKKMDGHVLEIGSGTGQHIGHFAPQKTSIIWYPSDCGEDCFWAIKERTKDSKNVRVPGKVNLLEESWTVDASKLLDGSVKKFDGIYTCNVCHIAPWEATVSLMKNAPKIMSEGGLLCIYGPFIIDGKSAESNFRFSKMLQARVPHQGVRELREIEKEANRAGMQLKEVVNMPANNNMLVFGFENKM
mmetsp:Transcript_24342/g.58763  ORF Transcript_24342/g.58763 Transcript_24342/m.58763 type:complete len:216 (+) Transcript_24342:368-1015(+)|eukprot:CAMPEP_0114505404 /NCGR_PEP_ID=MMETSP0109-20121206/10836_1 /TAXON_ID=29199 /ORGANISM="Chlorarachnion reptans, Strain CCCM449" /LENGTH=215 /DNA_ID=CAMNT_0001683843 /DNA_START=272 /DNA_END=922 /DNA_ORIENTATION=+